MARSLCGEFCAKWTRNGLGGRFIFQAAFGEATEQIFRQEGQVGIGRSGLLKQFEVCVLPRLRIVLDAPGL
jgi:hypothetical protein